MAVAVGVAGETSSRASRGRQRLDLNIRIDLDGTVPFRRTSDLRVPSGGGVYLLHDLRGVLYVGLSGDLRRRFLEHERQPANPLVAVARSSPVGPLSFSWIAVRDALRRSAVEAELIGALDPPCNRCTPAFPRPTAALVEKD